MFAVLQCLQYATEHTQDVKKLEKLTSQLMRHMASKETKWELFVNISRVTFVTMHHRCWEVTMRGWPAVSGFSTRLSHPTWHPAQLYMKKEWINYCAEHLKKVTLRHEGVPIWTLYSGFPTHQPHPNIMTEEPINYFAGPWTPHLIVLRFLKVVVGIYFYSQS